MILALEMPSIPAWLTTALAAGVAAFLGAYLGKRGERRAIQETVNEVERRIADITEAARLRWSKRTEVCSSLYGKLMMAQREFCIYLSPGTTSTDKAVERLCQRGMPFDDDFAQNALFLPREIKERMQWISSEFVRVFNQTTLLRPDKAHVEPGKQESQHEAHLRKQHYGQKIEELKRFEREGDIAKAIAELETQLRTALDLD